MGDARCCYKDGRKKYWFILTTKQRTIRCPVNKTSLFAPSQTGENIQGNE